MWWVHVLVFYGGFTVGFVLCALLSANKRMVADEAEAWLQERTGE